MNYVKFFLNMLLVPVFFTLVLVKGIFSAFIEAYRDTVDAVKTTVFMYIK